MLETAGVVDLKTLLQDGTKVRAVAGKGSLHRRKKLEMQLKQARKVVRELDRKAQADEAVDERRKAAQKRAAQEAVDRGKAALEKLQKLEQKTALKEQGKLHPSASGL